ncbi:MAG: radical SAM protein [Chloroflexi bacterium]|nr:radical SAM protein [Chloroflexota bacterium]
MRVAIVYPPIMKDGHYALLSQNRWFKYTASKAVRIFPLVPASAATLLRDDGHEVCFLDGITERLSPEEFLARLRQFQPNLVVMETKTPVVRRQWEIAETIRSTCDARIAFVGDHCTVFPEESIISGSVDFCVAGGDYDITLRDLARHLENSAPMPSGVYYRANGQVQDSGAFELEADLNGLPYIDRMLTKWWHYGEAYLYHPAAYILSGRGCGVDMARAGTCTFCVWQHALWRRTARLRSPENVAGEIRELVERYKVKEIFDDNEAGPFWDREWLRDFSKVMLRTGLAGRVRLSANARADALDDEICHLQRESGFRLLKIGLESGCNDTLALLSKQETRERIAEGVRTAKDHGIAVLLTTMVGYPWETDEEAAETYRFARDLLLYKTRLGDSLQASIVVPYPGTPLHRQAEREGWLVVEPGDYDSYDMSRPVLKTNMKAQYWCNRMWRVMYEPAFIMRTLTSIRSGDDVALLWRGIRSLMGHLQDSRGKSS